jgi:hypothetical protein
MKGGLLMDSSDQLLKIIDDRTKKNISPNIVYRTSMIVTSIIDNTKIKAIIPGYTTEYTFLNKTGEILVVGDNVIVESNGTNLNNGLVTYKFGTSPIFEQAIESGADYIKYADGTMICWLKTTVTSDWTTVYITGVLWQHNTTWTFPQTFIDAPVVTCGRYQWGTGASWGQSASTTTTTTNLRGLDGRTNASGTITIEAMAIGKWK